MKSLITLPGKPRQLGPLYPGAFSPGRAAAGLAVALLGMMLCTSQTVSAAPGQTEAFFAEPISGRRVTEYQIELPTGRSEKRTFSIPEDCTEVMRCVDEGAMYRSTVIDRRLWHKADGDCRFYSFLYHQPQEVMADYVSDYDFRNARLSDLPIDPDCSEGLPGCNPAVTGPLGTLRYFPLGRPSHGAEVDHEVTSCELKDGLFRGELYIDGDHFHCDAGPGAPTLRLIAVDFADINGDHYLDAVLRFVPVMPGAPRTPLILPLTRTEPDGPFHVPQTGPVPAPLTPLEDR